MDFQPAVSEIKRFMRKILLCILIFFPVILLISGYLRFRSGNDISARNLESVHLKEGDLVFRRGKSLESFAVVVTAGNGGFSHVGVIVLEGGKPFVIHVEPGENALNSEPVRKERLSSFLDAGKASHFAVYRSCLGRRDLDRVIVKARSFYTRKCRFDNSYDMQTDQTLYCTELVLKAYQQGGLQINMVLKELNEVNILVARRKILMPGAFISSELFYKICDQ
jgi:hypothetical protein